jgi:hypothetical protein
MSIVETAFLVIIVAAFGAFAVVVGRADANSTQSRKGH